MFCWLYGKICCKSSLILRQLYHFATDFDRVLLRLVNILNTLFKYCVGYRQLTYITWTFESLVKSCAKFDLLFLNIQCITACLFEKKLKFKLLYVLNHISIFFNKTCRIHVNTLKDWLKFLLPLLKSQIFFIPDCFYWRTVYLHCVSKNGTDVAHYNFNAHQRILLIFSRDVAEWVCSMLANSNLLFHLS